MPNKTIQSILFKKQQQYQQLIEKKRLPTCTDKICEQETRIICLKRKLNDTTAKLNEIKEKYDELRPRQQFMKWVEDQCEKLSDMRPKLENPYIKSVELQEFLLYIKECNVQAEIIDMKNEKLQKKIDKKNDRIRELVGKLQIIKTENTELKESLKIQENKINQLESVLSRPGITAALMRATADNNDQRETEHNNDEIIPTVSISPFGSSSRSSSPRRLLVLPSFGNASVVNSSGQRECSQSGSQNLRELINGSAQFNVEQNISSNIDEPPQRGQRKRRRLVYTYEESGDDIMYRPYNSKERR